MTIHLRQCELRNLDMSRFMDKRPLWMTEVDRHAIWYLKIEFAAVMLLRLLGGRHS